MTLGAVAIVKDEADRIDELVDNLLEVCDGPLTFVDTGSTDCTVRHLERRGIRVHHRPFVDFGTTRSEAFALARGTADWLLATDADMRWSIDGWDPDPDIDAYMVELGTPAFSYRLPLVLRGDRPWISRGAVHEYTLLEDGSLGRRETTDEIRIAMPEPSPTTPEKLAWHASLLEAELARSPNDPRTLFYLAQTRRDQGRPAEARELYLRRAAMAGWDEETFYARYMAASLASTWPERLAELIAAWEFRPTRLEPLYDAIYGLNERGHHRTAAALSRLAPELSETSDVLFVHRGVWEWGFAHERSRALAAA